MYSVTWSLSDLRLAAWQMPIDATDSSLAIDAIRHQVRRCEENGIAVLCCPEGAIGGLADYVRGPATIAIATGDVAHRLAPINSYAVAAIVAAVRQGGGVVAWVLSRMSTMPRHFSAILGADLATRS